MITRDDFDTHPISQFLKWYEAAEKTEIKQPEAMTLATATRGGVPSARIVLYKGLNEKGLCFFTNYQSRKARELKTNPRAAMVFYWPSLDRQIRIEGKVERLTEEESNDYWTTRPRESQVGAMASVQSKIIPNREFLEKQTAKVTRQYLNKEIPRPTNWGGFCLVPNRFEFWQLGPHRLHDRFCYVKSGKNWKLLQLSP